MSIREGKRERGEREQEKRKRERKEKERKECERYVEKRKELMILRECYHWRQSTNEVRVRERLDRATNLMSSW